MILGVVDIRAEKTNTHVSKKRILADQILLLPKVVLISGVNIHTDNACPEASRATEPLEITIVVARQLVGNRCSKRAQLLGTLSDRPQLVCTLRLLDTEGTLYRVNDTCRHARQHCMDIVHQVPPAA